MRKKSDPNANMPHRFLRLAITNTIRVIVRILYRLKYEGLENIPASGPAILVCNHTSMIDMLVIHTVFPPWIHWVAKKELFKTKFWNRLFLNIGCLPVDRDKTDLQAARAIFTTLRNKQVVGMFPQGTRVKPENVNYVLPRSGTIHFAIKTGAPILPVAIDGRFKLFGKVRIVFGPMINLNLDSHQNYSAEELERLSIDLMRRVYNLIGVDYQPTDRPGENEK